jgi:signal transduction histidine kinase
VPTLRPRARLVRTIGDQLISGPEAALIELVKNAYDADSRQVLLWILPQGSPESPEGTIYVSDEGHGMSATDITEKWLEPATDEKLKRRYSPDGRRLLGAKGIGRFAAARLGRFTKVESVHQSNGRRSLTTVELDWEWFSGSKYLDQIEIPVRTEELPLDSIRKCGVTLEIRELRDAWTQKKIENLIRELRRVASPPGQTASNFTIRLDLRAFKESVHGFDGAELLQNMNVSPGASGEAREDIDQLAIRPFELQAHADYKLCGSFNANGAFEGTFIVDRGDKLQQQVSIAAPSVLVDESACGAFKIELNIYDRENDAVAALFERMGFDFKKIGIQVARRILTDNSGISIFRKGFRIRPYGDPENDWLELESKRVQDPSRKLGISQVSGIVEIAEDESTGLVERSSREGLEHTPAFERLKRLIAGLLLHVEARRFDFREKAGISRRPKGDLSRVRETASLRRSAKAAQELPSKYRRAVEAAIEKDAAALAEELGEIDEYQQALQSRSALGLVVAEVLHEGRRLLNPVSTSAKALLDGTSWMLEQSKRGSVFRDQFPKLTSTIFNGVSELGRLFKRLDPISGRRRGRPKAYAISSVVVRCLELFREQARSNAIDIEAEVDPTFEAYGFDEDLQAALMNVVDNAIYWLASSDSPRIIKIHARKRGKTIELAVENNGPPIDEHYVPRLFDAGFTLKSDGTGLGLAIAREALRRSGGDLIYDERGEVTRFLVRLRSDPVA